MKIIQIVPGIKDESAGPSYYMLGLCRSLKILNQDIELHLLCSNSLQESFKIKVYPKHFLPHPSLGRSPEMYSGLRAACGNADIVHNNSLWMMPNIYPGKAVDGTRCKLVTSPHGTLAPWALNRRKYFKKIIGNFLGQYHTLQRTDMFHATCMKEYREIRAAGYTQPVAVIPIGIDIPAVQREHGPRRKLLFLGRLHPVKAVDRLLQAWAIVASDFPDWDFQIVGPDCGLKNTLLEMVAEHRIPRVEFIGEKNGMDKFKCYAAADLYVLPSFTENFGLTVAEALASATPVIVSKSIPWHDVEKHHCGWITDNMSEALAIQLRESMGMSRKDLETIGNHGKQWMQQEYSWRSIGPKMLQAYQWLLGEIKKPEFIILE